MDDLITNKLMGEITFIAGNEGGTLEKACKQVFSWAKDHKLIVVVWHPEWMDDEKFWRRVAVTMAGQNSKVSTLVVSFDDTLEEMRNGDGGARLPLLFRLLGRDSQSHHGCCQITDFPHLGGAVVEFDPSDLETSIVLDGNRIMGLFPPTSEAGS